MFASTIFNYLFGRLVGKPEIKIDRGRSRKPRFILAISVMVNIGNFVVFKYSDMLVSWIDEIPGFSIPSPQITFPIGISFLLFKQCLML